MWPDDDDDVITAQLITNVENNDSVDVVLTELYLSTATNNHHQ